MFSWLKKSKLEATDAEATSDAPQEPTVAEALLSERPSDIFARWAETGRLATLLPDLDALRRVSQLPAHRDNAFIHTMKVVDAIEPTPIRRWAGLLHDIAKAPTFIETPDGRSHFFEHDRIGADIAWEIMQAQAEAAENIAAVQCLIRMHMRPLSYSENWTDGAVRRLVEEAEEGRGRAGWNDLIALSRADLRGYLPEPIDRGLWVLGNLEKRRFDLDMAEQWEAAQQAREPRSPLDGTEILALGDREPGPWVGDVKDYLQQEVRSGRLSPDDKTLAAQLALRWLEASRS